MATEASVSVSKKNGPYPLAILKTHDKEEFQQFGKNEKKWRENNTLSEVVFPATDERGVATLRLLAAAREAADAIAATPLQPLLPFPLKTTKEKLQNPNPKTRLEAV